MSNKPSLAEVVARAQARSDTDPTWRTDYSDKRDTPCERAGVHLSGTGHSQTDCHTLNAE